MFVTKGRCDVVRKITRNVFDTRTSLRLDLRTTGGTMAAVETNRRKVAARLEREGWGES